MHKEYIFSILKAFDLSKKAVLKHFGLRFTHEGMLFPAYECVRHRLHNKGRLTAPKKNMYMSISIFYIPIIIGYEKALN